MGLLESCSFPGYAALLGSWYGPTQLAKRVALFEQSSAIASMFSGYLQAALYTGMNGKSGLKGWQWLFIFDAIISIPIAVWGYFAIPDHPSTTRAFWLKKQVQLSSAPFLKCFLLINLGPRIRRPERSKDGPRAVCQINLEETAQYIHRMAPVGVHLSLSVRPHA